MINLALFFISQTSASADMGDISGKYEVQMDPIVHSKGCARDPSSRKEVWNFSRQPSGRWKATVEGKTNIFYVGFDELGVLKLQSVISKKGKIVSTSNLSLKFAQDGFEGHRLVANSVKCAYAYSIKGSKSAVD